MFSKFVDCFFYLKLSKRTKVALELPVKKYINSTFYLFAGGMGLIVLDLTSQSQATK
jgi:hypothetical protein